MNPPPARTRRKRPDGQQTRAAPARRGRGPRGRAGLRRRAAGRLGAGAVTGGSSAPLAAGPHAGLAAPTGRFSLTPQESRCRGSVRNDPGLEWRGLGRRGPATGPQGARPRALPGVPAAGDWGLARDARSSGDPPVRRVKCPYPQKEQLCRGCRGAAAGGAGAGLSPGGPHSSASHAHPQTAGKQRGAPRSPLVARRLVRRAKPRGPGGPARPARKTQGGTGPGTALRRQPREEGSQRAPEASSARPRLRQVGTQGVAGSWRATQPRAQRARAAGDTGDSHVWVVQGQTAAGGRAGGRSSPSEPRRSAPPGTAPWRARKWRWRQWSLDWENFANQTTAENAAGVPVSLRCRWDTGPGPGRAAAVWEWPVALGPASAVSSRRRTSGGERQPAKSS